MFDYKGYSAQWLENLANLKRAERGRNKRVYWASENYSIGVAFRAYAGDYPSYLPLYIYSQHGAGYEPKPRPHELKTTAEAMVVWSAESFGHFSQQMHIPCYQVPMPYVWYRREKGYEQTPEAKGTLVMPFHTTPEIDVIFDYEGYINKLMALPAEFHPICYCLTAADINIGGHKAFIERGLPVYTAGHGEDIRFIDRLYGLLRNFKYTMSNTVGSSAYYSVEMGIPFSLYGELPEVINRSNPNRPPGKIDYATSPYVIEERRVFQGITTAISPEQAEFVKRMLGIGEGLSREEFSEVLWRAYKKRGNRLLDAVSAARRTVKYWFKTTNPF